jgi:hypothetical protein
MNPKSTTNTLKETNAAINFPRKARWWADNPSVMTDDIMMLF